jgi:sugar phosphate isomerase/epimerase
VKRSIDFASRIGASTIVIHSGHTTPDRDKLEIKLRELLNTGQYDSDEYRSIQARMLSVRDEHMVAGFDAVRNSILELLVYAEPFGICLGLENRYHYLEFPSPDELEVLLGLGYPNRLGFVYDVGHAYTLDRLGFYANEEWLKRFSTRIVITHLHDLIGINDHYAPGMGDVDFGIIAGYLPAKALRTVEVTPHNTIEQISTGLKLLVESGCVNLVH